jgi:hypothetical protein
MKIFTLKRIASLLVLSAMLALSNFKAGAKLVTEHSGLALVNENKNVLHAEVSDAAINLGAAITAVTAPVATPATSVGSTSFQANWNEVLGVDGYLLYVYTKTGRLSIKTYIENYNPKPVPGAKTNFNFNAHLRNTHRLNHSNNITIRPTRIF